MSTSGLINYWKTQLTGTSDDLANPAGFIEITDYDLNAAGGQVVIIVTGGGTDTCAVCCRGDSSCCCGGTCGCPQAS